MKKYEETIKQADQAAIDGKTEEAFELYKEAIDLEPERLEAYYNIALLYHQQGQLEPAIANFEKAVELNPSDASVFNNLGVLYYSKERLEEAERSFKKAIEIELDYADAFYGLGKVYQKYAEADEPQKLEQYKSEIKNRIEMLYEQGSIEKAWNISKKLIKIALNDAENQNDYAVLCYELGKIEEAREAIDKAKELSPEDTNIKENYQTIYSNDWEDWKGEVSL